MAFLEKSPKHYINTVKALVFYSFRACCLFLGQVRLQLDECPGNLQEDELSRDFFFIESNSTTQGKMQPLLVTKSKDEQNVKVGKSTMCHV